MKKDEEMISTNGIMYKIKNFFKNIFKKKEVEEVQEEVPNGSSFNDSISIKKDEEREKIIELQKRFKEGKLNPEDVTEEELDKLMDLYNEQIAELNKQIEQDTVIIEKCNKEIEEYKKKKI